MRRKNDWNIDTIDISEKPAVGRGSLSAEEESEDRFVTWLRNNAKKIGIITAVVYTVFLLTGIVNTKYFVDDAGKKKPVSVNMSVLQQRDDYEAFLGELSKIRQLLVDMTIIDIKFANQQYTNFEAATYYQKLLDEKIDVMIPVIKSMEISKDYVVIQNAMTGLLSESLAVYLQQMVSGLNGNNKQTVLSAIQFREYALKSHLEIEAEVKKIGTELKEEINPFFTWELGEAVRKADPTAVLENGGEK